MKPLNNSENFGKFWTADTTLQEEVDLKKLTHFSEDEKAEELYFSYLAKEKQVPILLEKEIWKSIEKRNEKKVSLIARWSIAASIIVMLGISGYTVHKQRQANLEMQFALIEQTLEHVSSELTSAPQQVIYEDDVIVIVAEN